MITLEKACEIYYSKYFTGEPYDTSILAYVEEADDAWLFPIGVSAKYNRRLIGALQPAVMKSTGEMKWVSISEYGARPHRDVTDEATRICVRLRKECEAHHGNGDQPQ